MLKKNAIVILKSVVAVVLLTVVLRNLYFSLKGEKLADAILKIDFNYWFFVVSILITFISLILGCVQWRMLLRVQGIEVPFKSILSMFFVGLFFNNFMPGNVGGDVKKVYDVHKYTDDLSGSFTATFFDRLIGLFAINFISLVTGWIFFYGNKDMDLFLAGATWIFCGIALFMAGLFSRRLGSLLERLIRFFKLHKVADMYAKLRSSFHLYRSWMLWGKMVPLSIVIQLLRVLSKYFIALSIGVFFPSSIFLFLVPLIDIVTAVPISIGGHGVREMAAIKVYGSVGISQLNGILIQELAYISLAVISLWGAYRFVVHKQMRADV